MDYNTREWDFALSESIKNVLQEHKIKIPGFLLNGVIKELIYISKDTYGKVTNGKQFNANMEETIHDDSIRIAIFFIIKKYRIKIEDSKILAMTREAVSGMKNIYKERNEENDNR